MKKWSILTLVGADKPGIVAEVTASLAEAGCELAETSMMQMSGNFAMMLRCQHQANDLNEILKPVCETLHLKLHIDDDSTSQISHSEPDVSVTAYGKDRTGIMAEVTSVLSAAGLNIIDLETALAGTAKQPIYVMTIEGNALQGIDALLAAAESISKNIDVNITAIETLRA